MSSPSVLFKISKHNPIVAYYIRHWMNGNFKFEEMLLNCYSALEQQCSDLVAEYKLKYHLPNERPALWIEDELERHRNIINAIHKTYLIYEDIKQLVMSKLEKRIPVIIQNTVTGEVTFSYKDEVETNE